MKVWQAKISSSFQQAASTVTNLSDTARSKALAGASGSFTGGASGVLGTLTGGGSFTGGTGKAGGSGQPCVQVTPEAAQKIRWYEKGEVAQLAQAHSREKEELWALNEALKQLLVRHGVPGSALEEELAFQMGEMERLRSDDEGVFAVLLAGAHRELQAMREASTSSAITSPSEAAAGGGALAALPEDREAGGWRGEEGGEEGAAATPAGADGGGGAPALALVPPSPSPVVMATPLGPLQRLRDAARMVAEATPTAQLGEASGEASNDVSAALQKDGQGAAQQQQQADDGEEVEAGGGGPAPSQGPGVGAPSQGAGAVVPVPRDVLIVLAEALHEMDASWPAGGQGLGDAVRELSFLGASGDVPTPPPGATTTDGSIGADASAAASAAAAADAAAGQLQQRVQELEEMLAREKERADAASSEAEGLAAEVERTRDEAEHALQDLRGRLNRSVQEHVEVLKQAQEICKSAEDRAAAMERRSDMFEVRAGQAVAEAKESKEEVKRLDRDLKRLQRESGRVEAAGRLQSRVRQLEEEAAASAKTIASLQLSKEQLERRVAELERAESQLSAELVAAEDGMRGHEALTLRAVTLEERLKDYNLLRGQLDNARCLVDELEAKLGEGREELVSTAQLASRLEAKAARAEAELEGYKTRAQSAELRTLKLEQHISQEVARRLAAAGEDRDQWPAAAREAVDRAERRLGEAEEVIAALRADLSTAAKAREMESQHKVAQQQKLAAAEERLQRLEWESGQRAAALQREVDSLREDLEETGRALAAAEEAADAARASALTRAGSSSSSGFGAAAAAGATKQYGGGSLHGMGDGGGAGAGRGPADGATQQQQQRDAVGGVDVMYLKNVLLKFLDAYVHGRAQECGLLLPAVATVVRATPQEFKDLKQSIESQQGWAGWAISFS